MLPLAIRLASLVPILAGGAGVWLGVALLDEPGGPAVGSHLRYLSGLLLGMGLLAFWCASDLRRRRAIFSAICGVFVLGGLARALGVALEGLPPLPHVFALGMELGVVPALWLAVRRAKATESARGGSVSFMG